ncbi:MAG: tRNA-uridine aminocarboxypropyltransferase [Polyangiaceae bacterium]
MRSRTPLTLEGHCRRCYLRSEHCMCAVLPQVECETEVVIVRHVVESRLTSNTGRLAALCLPRCHIIEYGGGPDFDDTQLPTTDAVLLYPGPTVPASELPRPRHIVVLDATFRQARRMYKRISALRGLPQLALQAPTVVPQRLRTPPHPDGMSTIEAIAEALALIENPDRKPPLLRCYEEFVLRASRQRGRIHRPSKPVDTNVVP